jgi:hypothetical protein
MVMVSAQICNRDSLTRNSKLIKRKFQWVGQKFWVRPDGIFYLNFIMFSCLNIKNRLQRGDIRQSVTKLKLCNFCEFWNLEVQCNYTYGEVRQTAQRILKDFSFPGLCKTRGRTIYKGEKFALTLWRRLLAYKVGMVYIFDPVTRRSGLHCAESASALCQVTVHAIPLWPNFLNVWIWKIGQKWLLYAPVRVETSDSSNRKTFCQTKSRETISLS